MFLFLVILMFLPVRRLLARYLLSKDGWLAGWLAVTHRYCVYLNLS